MVVILSCGRKLLIGRVAVEQTKVKRKKGCRGRESTSSDEAA